MDRGFWRRRLIASMLDGFRAIGRSLQWWRFGSVLLAALLAGGAFAPAADTPSLASIASLELRDLEGNLDSLDAHRGQAVVVMVVNARRLRTLKAWEKDLRDRFADLHYLRIADVPRDPPTTYERVVAKLGQRVPEEVPVLIDMDGAWSTALGLDTDRPNLLLVRPDGTLAATFEGRHGLELADRVAASLRELMEQE